MSRATTAACVGLLALATAGCQRATDASARVDAGDVGEEPRADLTDGAAAAERAWTDYETGLQHFRAGRFEAALEAFLQAGAGGLRHVDLSINRAMARRELGQLDEALADYDRALELDRQSFHAWLGRGVVLRALERPEDALVAIASALDVDPESRDAHHTRAAALTDLGRSRQALLALERAVALDRDVPAELAFSYALALGREGQLDGCFLWLERSLQGNPDLLDFARRHPVFRQLAQDPIHAPRFLELSKSW